MKLYILLLLVSTSLFSQSWSLRVSGGYGRMETDTSTRRMYARAFEDAIFEERNVYPELILPVLFHPPRTKISYIDTNLKIQGEYKWTESLRLNFGLSYSRFGLSESSTSELRRRQDESRLLTRNLSLENQIRGTAYIATSYLEYTAFYTVDLGGRYVFQREKWEPYFLGDIGAGTCVDGPACNVFRITLGTGIEWKVGKNYGIFSELRGTHITQTQQLIQFQSKEAMLGLGIRWSF
ncbi:MAG: hypothetical protein SFU98_05600 [Leptospiraceae bacterium]|nr:hypothetical protein [Leptospiraceae bacterium]